MSGTETRLEVERLRARLDRLTRACNDLAIALDTWARSCRGRDTLGAALVGEDIARILRHAVSVANPADAEEVFP